MSEQIMILRYLVRMSKTWSIIISDIIKENLINKENNYLSISALSYKNLNIDSCNKYIFRLFGSLVFLVVILIQYVLEQNVIIFQKEYLQLLHQELLVKIK